jgi:hypothetical protein
MDVTFAHLCDYAIVSREGKLSIMGIFGSITAVQLPATHPQMFLAFEMAGSTAEAGRNMTLRIDCVDGDGNELLKMEVQVGLAARKPTPGGKIILGQVMGINQLQLTRYGMHNFNIFIDGTFKKSLEFEVKKPPAAAAPGLPPGTPRR